MARWLSSFVRSLSTVTLRADAPAGTGVADPPPASTDGDGDGVPDKPPECDTTTTTPPAGDKPPEWDALTYNGPADANPDNRPLRLSESERRSFPSREEMDRFVREYRTDAELFLTPEEVAAQTAEADAARKAKEAAEKPPEKPPEAPPEPTKPGDKPSDSKPPDTEAAELQAFLTDVGLDEATVRAMPEKARDALVTTWEKAKGTVPEVETLRKEHTTLKQRQAIIDKDPMIVARLRELATADGTLVARTVPALSTTDVPDAALSQISDAFDAEKPELARQAIANLANAYIQRVGPEVVKRERSVMTEREKAEAEKTAAVAKICSIGSGDKPLDARMAFKPEDFDRETYDPNTVLGKFATYIRERGYSATQMNKMAPAEIHAGFSAYMGWDKETHTKIADEARKRLLKTLASPQPPTSVPPGNRPGTSESRTVMEVSEADLKAEIVRGEEDRYVTLVQRADARGDLATLARLDKLYREARMEANRQPAKK